MDGISAHKAIVNDRHADEAPQEKSDVLQNGLEGFLRALTTVVTVCMSVSAYTKWNWYTLSTSLLAKTMQVPERMFMSMYSTALNWPPDRAAILIV